MSRNEEFHAARTVHTESGPVSIAYEGQHEWNNHTPYSAGWHSVVARDQQNDVVGLMHWRKKAQGGKAGQVDWVEVDPSYKRQGIGRQMWEHAHESGVRPSPKHSNERTNDGDAWAKSVGGPLPRRKQ